MSFKCEYCNFNETNLFYCEECDELICCQCLYYHIELRNGIHLFPKIDINNFTYNHKFMKKKEIFDYINDRSVQEKKYINKIIYGFTCPSCLLFYEEISIIFEENRYLLYIKCDDCKESKKMKVNEIENKLIFNEDINFNKTSSKLPIDLSLLDEIKEKGYIFFYYINKIIYFILQNHFRKEKAIQLLDQICDGKFFYEFIQIIFYCYYNAYIEPSLKEEQQYFNHLYNKIMKIDLDILNFYLAETYNQLIFKKNNDITF